MTPDRQDDRAPWGEPLASVWRSDELESVHLGHLVVLDEAGHVRVSRGHVETPIWVRSAIKPVQALPLWLTGAADALGLEEAQLAVTMASHSGQSTHREAVAGLLAAAGLEAEQLGCGRHTPYNDEVATQLLRQGQTPDLLHCNCSGKHAGMLAVCRHMGWDLASYRDPQHPLQEMIRDLLAVFAGVHRETIGHGVDGCGAPVWRLPLIGLARAYHRLCRPEGLPDELAQVARRAAAVFAAHPLAIAGSGRLDTALVEAGAGRLLAKIGGEAVHAGGWIGPGQAWALKIGDGNKRAIGPALARAMALAGAPLPSSATLEGHLNPPVDNNHGTIVGAVRAAW
ncbi:MAG: asparaginase [Candidatus Sericytochromatia bacterium]|nr:asparaginase [Candidatus Sericytochromatia bacterium]